MARCAVCGTTILFGGVTEGELRFCGNECHQGGYLLAIADRVPRDVMAEQVAQVHQGDCPRCGGPGPVDVHTSHSVWSALVMTQWKSTPEVCCRACGIKSKLVGTLSSGVLGWWGFPWGVIFTPIQILRNVSGLFSAPDPTVPSAELEKMVRLQLASQFVAAKRQEQGR
ncbi:MAG: hypothetical protein KF708_19205 [Pirellulales bacterium]|nr:hypothetical protein [Pirellulales bacterium]